MNRPIRILYHVSSHGFGHLNRAAAVIEALPPFVDVVARTHPDQFSAWPTSVRRKCELQPGVFDSGTVHFPGKSSSVDPVRTLELYSEIHRAAERSLEAEVEALRRGQFAAVVSDIASFPLRVARLAGVPSILIANFTWHDIFTPYATRMAGFRTVLDTLGREYACADVHLHAEPGIEPKSMARIEKSVGLVGRRGLQRRRELVAELGLKHDARIVYIYVGRYGQDDMDWHNLTRLNDYQFVSYYPNDSGLSNWHVVDGKRWPPRDLAASVDAFLTKAGYGTVTDAIMHRTPIVFPPRADFVEHRALAAALRLWGGGVAISSRDYRTLRVGSHLARAVALQPRKSLWPTNGAERCARTIVRLATRFAQRDR